MRKLDPRSVIIGFLLAVIGFMSIGATDKTAKFDTIEVNKIFIRDGGLISFYDPSPSKTFFVNKDGLMMLNMGTRSETLKAGRLYDGQYLGVQITGEAESTTLVSFGVHKN